MIGTSSDGEAGIGGMEARLYRQLGIPLAFLQAPASRASEGPVTDSINLALRELHHDVSELRREAARIGTIPEHYPPHIVFVMACNSSPRSTSEFDSDVHLKLAGSIGLRGDRTEGCRRRRQVGSTLEAAE